MKGVQDELHFLDAFEAHFAVLQDVGDSGELLVVGALQEDDGLELLDLLLGEAIFTELGIDIVDAYLVELIDGYGDIYYLVGGTDDFGDTGEDLAVVDLDLDTDAQATEHLVDNLHELDLVEQGVGTDHIAIELIELTVATLLRAVGTPYGLYLIALEGHLEFLTVHHHITGKGHRQVVAETFLCRLGGLGTTVLNTEQQLVAFLAVFAHQRLQGFLCRGLYLLETIELIDGADGVEDIVALGHLNGTKVARSLWNTWFHIIQIRNEK